MTKFITGAVLMLLMAGSFLVPLWLAVNVTPWLIILCPIFLGGLLGVTLL